MFNLFKKKKPVLDKYGYILVVSFDTKTASAVNYVYNKNENKFEIKRLFTESYISEESRFKDLEDARDALAYKKEHKRFLAGKNIEGIYYVETSVIEKPDNVYGIMTETKPMFYVPSAMKLYLDPEKPDFKNDNNYNQK